MPFPTNTTLLDDFNRENGAIGANWTADALGFGSDLATIESNQARSPAGGAGWSEAYWNPATFGPDFEVYVQVPVKPANNQIAGIHWVHPTGLGGTGVDGFSAYLRPLSGTDSLVIERFTNQTWQTLQEAFQEFTAGWWFGLERIGTTIAGYYFNGSIWTQFATQTDANHAGVAGRLAFDMEGTTCRFDNFMGGTVVVADPTIEQLASQWREDDGSESGASAIGDPGDTLVRPILSPVRLRIQLDATDNPDAITPLKEYRIVRSSKPDEWRKVKVP